MTSGQETELTRRRLQSPYGVSDGWNGWSVKSDDQDWLRKEFGSFEFLETGQIKKSSL